MFWVFFVVFFFFLVVLQGSWILVPRPGTEPVPPALEAQSPDHWTAREVPRRCIWNFQDNYHLYKFYLKNSRFAIG